MKALRSAHLPSSVQSSLLSTARPFQRKLLSVAVGVVLGSTILVPEIVVAQEQKKPTFSLETVVVTSRNREEIAQKVPLPVSVHETN